MQIAGQVFDPSSAGTADTASATLNMGRANELLVAELHGKYFTQNYRGNLFIGSTSTTGITSVIATTTTPTYTIWNPAGSGKLCVPIVTLVSWNATTAALGGLVWMATTGAGSAIGATSPIVAFTTQTVPTSANFAATKASVMRFGNQATTITLTAGPTFYRAMGATILATTAASSAAGFFTLRDEWDGTGIITPGTAIHLMGTTATLAVIVVSTIWAEVPL